jgi:site-specific DNA-methyltransferase (adenine-specific)
VIKILEVNQIYNGDCLELMKDIKSKSIPLILCDLPYGVTNKSKNKWDFVIPPELLWKQYERIITDNGAILLFGQDKFTAKMMLSNEKLHRYNLIWNKVLPSGFLNANKMPLREHEDIMVFYKKPPIYNPQKVKGNPCHSKGKVVGKSNDENLNNSNYSNFTVVETEGDMKCPTSILRFTKPHPSVAIHPTEKPVELCRYLIRTYSNAGDLVLDNCCGSGSIPLAAKLENRNYIGIDNGVCEKKNSKYNGWFWADVARDRIENYAT